MRASFLLASTVGFLAGCMFLESTTAPAFIEPLQARVLEAWLRPQRDLRVALEADCDCASSIATIRETEPAYQPYYRTGDFNGDQVDDFAVALRGSGGKRLLVVFNGPYSVGAAPTYIGEADGALFTSPRGTVPQRLLIGAPFSEASALEPKGPSYELIPDECC